MGPYAGLHGGKIVAAGIPSLVKKSDGLTAKYLRGEEKIDLPESRRTGNGKFIH
ncbi:unnamed protein product, partial [marine sediment metagenome]